MNGPPQNVEAEEHALGAIMTGKAVLAQVLAEKNLEVEHFYRDRHRAIFAAAKALFDRGEPVEVLTVTDELDRRGELGQVGGKDVVASLAAKVPSPASGPHYAQIVIDAADLRRLDAVAKQLQASVAERDGEPGELIGRAQQMLDQAAPSGDPYMSPAALQNFIYDTAAEPPTGRVFPWPFEKLDQLSGGIRTGQTVLIAGWTHHGKSVVAGQLLESVGRAGANACLYFNEMDAEEHMGGWLQRNWNISSRDFVQRRLSSAAKQQLAKVTAKNPPPFGVCPAAGWSAKKIASHIRLHRFDVAVVDILHNIVYEDERDLSNAVTAFVQAAKLAECAVVLVAHLNRGRLIGKLREPPVLRDLRGTGDLENKADIVCFVHREQDEDTTHPLPEGEITIAKCRGGRLGGLPVRFDADRIRFRPVDKRWGEPAFQISGAEG